MCKNKKCCRNIKCIIKISLASLLLIGFPFLLQLIFKLCKRCDLLTISDCLQYYGVIMGFVVSILIYRKTRKDTMQDAIMELDRNMYPKLDIDFSTEKQMLSVVNNRIFDYKLINISFDGEEVWKDSQFLNGKKKTKIFFKKNSNRPSQITILTIDEDDTVWAIEYHLQDEYYIRTNIDRVGPGKDYK